MGPRVGGRLPVGPKGEGTRLFHVTMTHTEDNCSIYHKEMPALLESFPNLEALGKELNVKLHYFTTCGPAHVFYLLLEADTLSAINRYVFSMPMPQESQIVPVEHLHEATAMAKAATTQS